MTSATCSEYFSMPSSGPSPPDNSGTALSFYSQHLSCNRKFCGKVNGDGRFREFPERGVRRVRLSLLQTFPGGATDMVSVVVRGILIQLATPNDMRGRVNA